MQGSESPERAPLARSVTVALSGELDLAARDDIVEHVLEAVRRQPDCILVDLSGVTFIDCSGLNGLLLAREQALGAGIDLWVSARSAPVERLLGLTGTSDLLAGRA